MLRHLSIVEEQYPGLLLRSEHGCPMLKHLPILASDIRKEFGKKIKPIGKLLGFVDSAEIGENDGLDGRPDWLAVGREVFNITGKMNKRPSAHHRQ
jgi:hypothetical protein